MSYTFRGLSVGTLRGALTLKNFIRTPPFLFGLSNKKAKGDDEMEEQQEKRRPSRHPIRNCIFSSAKFERVLLLCSIIYWSDYKKQSNNRVV